MSDVDLLKRAARVLREHAERASGGPWNSGDEAVLRTPGTGPLRFALFRDPADAQYAALLHPPVGLAMADWLEREADTAERYQVETGSNPGDVLAAAGATAVARAVLREEES